MEQFEQDMANLEQQLAQTTIAKAPPQPQASVPLAAPAIEYQTEQPAISAPYPESVQQPIAQLSEPAKPVQSAKPAHQYMDIVYVLMCILAGCVAAYLCYLAVDKFLLTKHVKEDVTDPLAVI